MKQNSRIGFILCGLLAVALVLSAGCTGSGGDAQPSEQKSISIGYVLWDSEIASTNVVKQVFEKAGYDVTITAVDAAPLYQAIVSGDVDCTVSAWLPRTQKVYMDEYGDQLDFVRKNLEGAKIGLVVPTYVTIDSIEEMNEVKDKFDGKIVGIDAGAGVVNNAEDAIEEYDLDYDLVYSSSAGMASALKKSVDRAEWVVVTGWTPHWKFSRWDLKYLEDPKGVFGGEEYLGTLARPGLAEDDPEAYAILERFYWTPEDMESVMLDIEEGMSHEDAAKKWIDAHPDQVDAWLGKA
ncbi:glycine betaine/proline transport system substrate-binding protein [Methanofollis sp. W23]|uniref:glycine betaine ABC transporter substrate-binding protein n=1 Tax=Methanofollis sp. W23 TaxID=2817849 RepID=UPI001AEA2FBA|nr:glycine betaine ABC transporter substrate-binding protein [Methanofollis sp. W23]MBP2144987.1 glycine betaine/proline transport system substrate-binding protein [Methanofollis sp. W23]